MKRAIFLDRDGTVSEEVGYINHVSRLRLFPWTAEAIRAINGTDFMAVLVTNQAGVARGYFTEDLIGRVHSQLRAELAREGARLDAIFYCPHHPTAGEPPYRQACDCRKPRPGLLLRAAEELDIDLQSSYVVGDKFSDVELAWTVGARGVLVLSGYGRGELEYQSQNWPGRPNYIAEDLKEAVDWILVDAARGGADE